MALGTTAIRAVWRLAKALRTPLLMIPATARSRDSVSPNAQSGAGAPTHTAPNGSIYLRTDGGPTTVIYVRAAAAWTAVAVTGVDFGAGGLLTDLIAESTAGAGVTIDGLRVKDGTIDPTAGGSAWIDLTNVATGEAIAKMADNLANALEFKEAGNSYLKFVTTNASEKIVAAKDVQFSSANGAVTDTVTERTGAAGVTIDGLLLKDGSSRPTLIADPGDAGAISVASTGVVPIVTAAAETRTLANPTFPGQTIDLAMKTDGGNCVVTVASAFNQAGQTLITFDDAGDHVHLVAVSLAAGNVWRIVVNNGSTLG